MKLPARITRRFLTLLASLGMAALAQPARADLEIQLGASQTQVAIGEIVDVALDFDADETVLGGGFQVDFDPNLFEVVDFAFSRGLGDQSQYRCGIGVNECVSRGGGHRVPVGFGHFDGLSGQRAIGLLRLRALAPGTTDVEIVPYTRTGEFVDLAGDPVDTSSNRLGLTVVPEPGLATLLAGGVPGLVFLGRRRRS